MSFRNNSLIPSTSECSHVKATRCVEQFISWFWTLKTHIHLTTTNIPTMKPIVVFMVLLVSANLSNGLPTSRAHSVLCWRPNWVTPAYPKPMDGQKRQKTATPNKEPHCFANPTFNDFKWFQIRKMVEALKRWHYYQYWSTLPKDVEKLSTSSIIPLA